MTTDVSGEAFNVQVIRAARQASGNVDHLYTPPFKQLLRG